MKRHPDVTKDKGTFSTFTAIFALAVLLFAGLLIDGGLAIHGRQRALDVAEQAARAGADAIDVETLRETGEVVLDVGAECARVDLIMQQYDDIEAGDYECAEGAEEVQVTVTKTIETTFLSLIGINEFTMTVTAAAHPEEGV